MLVGEFFKIRCFKKKPQNRIHGPYRIISFTTLVKLMYTSVSMKMNRKKSRKIYHDLLIEGRGISKRRNNERENFSVTVYSFAPFFKKLQKAHISFLIKNFCGKNRSYQYVVFLLT